MNPRHVTLFVKVADVAGFSAAARALGLPKSVVSSAVAALETDLGVRLLHRSSRKVSLTDAGQAFYDRVTPALAALDEAASAAREMQTALRGTVRLSAPVEAGTRLLEPLVADFVKAHPGVSVEVQLTSRFIDFAEDGVDLALRGGPVRDASLVARQLRTLDSGLFAAPSYLAEHGLPVDVNELAQRDCVLFRATAGRATWALTGPSGERAVDVHGRISADHFAFALRAVVDSVGIGLLPLFLCDAEVAAGLLVRVLPEFGVRGTPLHLVYPSARLLPLRVAALRDFLVAGLREL